LDYEWVVIPRVPFVGFWLVSADAALWHAFDTGIVQEMRIQSELPPQVRRAKQLIPDEWGLRLLRQLN
jgi:hypothetical protein